MNDILEIGGFVIGNSRHVLPAFLLSVFIGILIRELKLDSVIKRAFQSNIGLSILLATAIGAFSPFCSCTVIPVVAGLLLSGVPLAPIMSFWIASPTMDPEIFSLSVATIGWELAVARLVATLLLSLGAGYLTWFLMSAGFLKGNILRPGKAAAAKSCCDTGKAETKVEKSCCAPVANSCCAPTTIQTVATLTRIKSVNQPVLAVATGGDAVFSTIDALLVINREKVNDSIPCCGSQDAEKTEETELSPSIAEKWHSQPLKNIHNLNWISVAKEVGVQSLSLGKWLVVAFVMEALITLYVPQQGIANVLGSDNIFSVPLAALVGIPLYLSNVGSLPIVAGLLAKGMAPGAAIAFLIAGPGTTVPAMTAVWGIVEKRVFALYIGIILGGAMILGFLTNLALG